MNVGELIEQLQKFDPSTVVVEDGVHTYCNHFDSSTITLTQGYFVKYEPGPDCDQGLFVEHQMAHTRHHKRKKFLDFTSPYIVPCIKLHWKRQ